MRTSFFVAVTSLASMLALAAACSSSTTTVVSGDAGDDEADATTTKDAGKDSSTKDAGEKDSAPADPDEACLAQSGDACGECCFNAHQEGAKVFSDSVLGCICNGTGSTDSQPVCATECANNYCSETGTEPKDGDACSTCLQTAISKGGKCVDTVVKDCQANDDCYTWQTACVGKCQ